MLNHTFWIMMMQSLFLCSKLLNPCVYCIPLYLLYSWYWIIYLTPTRPALVSYITYNVDGGVQFLWTTPKKYLHSAFKCRPLQLWPVRGNLRRWNVCFWWLTLNSTGERHISTFEVSRLNKRNKCIFFTFNLHRKFFWSTIKFARLFYVI